MDFGWMIKKLEKGFEIKQLENIIMENLTHIGYWKDVRKFNTND